MELISKEMQQKFNSNTIVMLEYLKMCIFVDRIINYNKIYKKTGAPMVTSRLHDPLFSYQPRKSKNIRFRYHLKKLYFCFAQITGKALWAISCPIQSVQDGIEIVCLITFTEIISNWHTPDLGFHWMTNTQYTGRLGSDLNISSFTEFNPSFLHDKFHPNPHILWAKKYLPLGQHMFKTNLVYSSLWEHPHWDQGEVVKQMRTLRLKFVGKCTRYTI